MKNVKWGIVGTGTIANKFAAAVRNSVGAELVAVASRKTETAKAFAEKYQIEKYFSSYEEMAAEEEIDAVYIATPHTHHAPCSALFMNAGKNVLCEKPITVNSGELSMLRELQKEKNVFLMEAMWTRFLPVISKIKEIIKDGVIGEVLEISADFCYNSSDRTGIAYDIKMAGGSLLDVGVYGLNFASIFLGNDVCDIKAVCYKNGGIDDRTNILLTYKGGKIARISSAIALYKPECGYIYGSKGYIHVPNFYGAVEFDVVTDDGETIKKYEAPFKGNGFEEEIEECNKCISSGKTQSEIMPLSESSKIMEIMDEIRRQVKIVYEADKKI